MIYTFLLIFFLALLWPIGKKGSTIKSSFCILYTWNIRDSQHAHKRLKKIGVFCNTDKKSLWKSFQLFFFFWLSLPRVRFCDLYWRAKYLIMLCTLMNWLDNSIIKQFYSETIKTKYNTQKRTQYHKFSKICLVNLEIILIIKLFVFSYTAFKIYFFSLLLLAIFELVSSGHRG